MAVVIPCYEVADQILNVLAGIGDEVDRIFVVDDLCPQRSGHIVESATDDPRVEVLYHETNQGVGAATLTGYGRAIDEGADIIVKLDGDGQMDPALIGRFIGPIEHHQADYAKGNRFHHIEGVRSMPMVRKLGNALLSFLTKLSTGYWRVFDPTNGFTAIEASVAKALPFDKIAKRYFFESDILFRLGILGAVVADIPMPATYGNEKSNLSVLRSIPEFSWKHLKNLWKRIVYDYFLRDFSIASIELATGLIFLTFGLVFGLTRWTESIREGVAASAGTVMVSALPILIGTQLLLSFLNFDIQRRGTIPLHVRTSSFRDHTTRGTDV